MKKMVICFLILTLVLLTGCTDVRTSKQKVQDNLLYELKYCDNKFGDYSSEKGRNAEYCREVLKLIERKIDEGWFNNPDEAKQVITIIEEKEPTINEEVKK